MRAPGLRAVILTVPERAAMVEDLHRRLGVAVPVFCDVDKRGHWWSWTQAMNKAAGLASAAGVTHGLVIEDDALPCRDFLAGAERAVVARPHSVISYYASRRETVQARERGSAWAPCAKWLNTQAMAWPVGTWRRCWTWLQSEEGMEHIRNEATPGADGWFQRWLERNRIKVMATAPSLVDHRPGPSTIKGHAGSRLWRAKWYIGEDASALDVDWSR